MLVLTLKATSNIYFKRFQDWADADVHQIQNVCSIYSQTLFIWTTSDENAYIYSQTLFIQTQTSFFRSICNQNSFIWTKNMLRLHFVNASA